MNLSEALDAALPEIPKTRLERSRPPQIDPDLVIREDVLDGEPVVGVLQRGKANFFRFPPAQWMLAQMFDGVCTYEEIAERFRTETGSATTAEEVRAFAEGMEEANFWYKTPQERNLAMSARLKAQRGRRAERKSKINLAHISFSGWDPDRYLTWLDRAAGRFIYSQWCVLAVVLLFAFETFVFIAKWNVIGPDIPVYYNFARKTFYDVVEFWLLLFALGFIHETAHGLTCKHYGGEVHQMGLMFLYLTPAFFVDVTETWVSATRLQRLATIIAGIWIEMVVCGFGMMTWLNTANGTWLHEFSYKVILITGIAVIVMNLNPLLKLDGYYFLTEFIGIPDLKERSTAFVSGWVQRHILRLPVEVVAVPRRRAPFFAIYALISGAYSYMLLFFFIRFVFNVSSHFLAEFALIPTGWIAFLMFKSRLKSLRSVVVQIWKHSFGRGADLRFSIALAAAALLILVFIPLWRDREGAYFAVEPMKESTLHAAVPGVVDAVMVREGETVRAGQPLLKMSSGTASALRSDAEAAAGSARYQAFEAELEGKSIGAAAAAQRAATASSEVAGDAQSSLGMKAPFDGVVITVDPASLVGRRVAAGDALLTIASSGPRVARIYSPASELDRIAPGAEVALAPAGHFSTIRLRLGPIDGEAVKLPGGLIPHQDYRGVELPSFYSARVALPAGRDELPYGASGRALIFGQRRSLFERFASGLLNLFRAHAW